MTVEALLARLRTLALAFPRKECPWEDRPVFERGVPLETVDKVRNAIGVTLPTDFVSFLQICGGVKAMSVRNGYWIGGVGQLMSPDFRSSFPSSIPDEAGSMAVIPIATDGGGNAFLLSARDGRICRWNHESGATKLVAASFGSFLEAVAADWEHELAGDESWNYLV
jgi:cell wall assembly regulator SMI1